MRAAHQPVRAGLQCEAREAQHLLARPTGNADLMQRFRIQAGQHGDREQLRTGRPGRVGGGACRLDHRPPTGGMQRQQRRGERQDRAHRAGDGVGNVVQLEVEKHRSVIDQANPLGPVGEVELQPELEHAAGRRHRTRPAPGALRVDRVEGRNQSRHSGAGKAGATPRALS